MKYILLAVILLCSVKAWAVTPCPVALRGATPTLVCTVAVSSSNNTMILTLGGGDVTFAPPTWTGSGTWVQIPIPYGGAYSGGAFQVWMIYGYTGGAGTFTVTETATATGGSDCINMTVLPLTMAATDFIEFQQGLTNGTILSLPQTLSTTSTQAGDAFYTAIFASPGESGPGSTVPNVNCSAGYTEIGIADDQGIGLTAVCYATGLSPGLQTNTFTTNGSVTPSWFKMVMRSSLPTFGAVQQIDCPSASATVSCEPLFATTAGSKLLVNPTCATFDNQYTLTNNATLTQILRPGHAFIVDEWEVPNPSSGAPTFTAVFSGGGANDCELYITEVVGLAPSNAYVDAASNFSLASEFAGAPDVSSWQSTPVHLLQAGTYYLHCPFSNATAQVITPSSGFVPRIINQYGLAKLNAIFDQVVSVVGPAEFNCQQSWATPTSAVNTGLYAYSSASYTLPHIVQTLLFGPQGAGHAAWFNPVASGSTLFINAQVTPNASGTWALSNTCGGTPTLVRGGTSSDQYAAWVINGVTGGSCGEAVTNSSGDYVLSTAGECDGCSTVLSGTSQISATTAVGTGNVATANPTSLIVSWGTACCDTNDSVVSGTDTSYSLTQQGYVDNAGNSMYTKVVLAPGTWNNSFVSYGATSYMAGIIVPATLTPLSLGTQPNVTVITMNGAEMPLFELGAAQ